MKLDDAGVNRPTIAFEAPPLACITGRGSSQRCRRHMLQRSLQCWFSRGCRRSVHWGSIAMLWCNLRRSCCCGRRGMEEVGVLVVLVLVVRRRVSWGGERR